MKEIGTSPSTHLRKHLHSPEAVARAAHGWAGADLTRGHGQGNGLRIHRIYFVVVSLVALVLVISAVGLATTKM